MTPLAGNAAAHAAFLSTVRIGGLHSAWLLAGPEGVGKASFARAAATMLLSEAATPGLRHDGFDVPPGDSARSLVEAGSHPDLRIITRLPKDADKPDQDLARSITIAQIRALQPMFARTPSLGPRRVVIIDAIDDVERGGANALLKNLEEPPQGTIFLLVSHAPGRLLPSIRSRCRVLRFEPLSDSDVARALRTALPQAPEDEIAGLVRVGEGAPGRAMRYAGLDVAGLDITLVKIAEDGDCDNARRLALGKALAGKAAQPRYEAFLDRAPSVVARLARDRQGPALRIALDAQSAARSLAEAARGLSLDTQATVIEMSGIVARLRTI